MKFGVNTIIQRDCWLDIAFENPHPGPMIIFGDGTNIGRRSTISAANMIVFGKWVLVGMNVYISDTGHEYHDINKPIIFQGITTTNGRVEIGDGTWIGTNAVILGVKIGEQCVIGASSVVTRDIPDYSVAVGNPARVIKTLKEQP